MSEEWKAHIESFHAVLEDECLRCSEFETFAEAHVAVMKYINFYNERRIHGSLNDLSPKQFREAVRAGRVKPLVNPKLTVFRNSF